ncbi:Cytochrome P450 90D2 [Ananas comosus]|uniref:Cytochrome P450 90D2 n=1 Tax=Ananas comosus TaxID=4615 RepID=A0A199VRT5_ANACO|nr:Cytochrome P450 90D2 [Ananas comosus]
MSTWLLMLLCAAVLVIIIIVGVTSIFHVKSWVLGRRKKLRRAQLPGGSLGWPFVGETIDFVSAAYSPCPETFMEKRRLLYGRVFKSHIFGSPTIVSTDAEVSRFVLQSDARSFVPSYPKSLTELMGKSSILLINGGLQRRVHGLIGAFFKSPHLKAQITSDMQRYVASSMARWPVDGPDHHRPHLVRIQDEAKLIVFQILVKGLIGLEPGKEMDFLKQQFQEFIAGLMSLPIKVPGSRLYRSLKAKKRMATLIQKIIQEKRRNTNSRAPRDAIDVLINDSSNLLTDELISDNMIDLMIPAEDSVPVLVTLAVKYLSECPLALKQLEAIAETLRMGNIISGIMRKAVRDVEIKGHFIPKGWCVFTYFRSVHLDESLYEDPYKFNPWRWKRLCPGLDLARLEASIFLHHLVTNFTWVAEDDQIVNFPTVRMKGRMPIRVKRKS